MTIEPPIADGPGSSPARTAETRSHRKGRLVPVLAWGLVVLAAAFAVGEWSGWPFLVPPLQYALAQRLDREVQLTTDDKGAERARVRFLGAVRLDAPWLRIGAPSWQAAAAAPTVEATSVHMALRYRDLWRAWRGDTLRIHALLAGTLDANLVRRDDGRATWQLGTAQDPANAANDHAATPLPIVGTLQVKQGSVHWVDPVFDADVTARFSLAAAETNGSPASAGGPRPARLTLTALGRVRKLPLKLDLRADGALPLLSDDIRAATLLRLEGQWGASTLEFDGTAVDVLRAREASGRFLIKGPSLAAVGDPFGVTLPTTKPFRAVGQVVRTGDQWQLAFDDATVGSSKLKGAFQYDAAAPIPVLSGRLTGARLYLSDLAPVVGASPVLKKERPGKVLPDRPFDLPSLRVMQANVLIDVQEVDLDTDVLEPLRPLRAHLTLKDGVLRLDRIDARTAQGRLQGSMQLDGRQDQAQWQADLRWSDVELAQWIHQDRAAGAPAYISGKLDGSLEWAGQGRSTAAILASVNGPMRIFLRQAQVSHLAVEVAGVDLFQSLGLLIKGDDRLAIRCGAAELQTRAGVMRPSVFVVDTDDSVLLVDGTLSLAQETLDLRVVVTPKDFSLVSLRSPLRVQGAFAQPRVSLEPSTIGARIAGSVLLGLINPLAALIPLIDPGDAAGTAKASAGCQALAGRVSSRSGAAPRAPVSRDGGRR